jgi:hypothetical protein
MGQGGNVGEWNETAYDGINNTAGEVRELRGGYYHSDDSRVLGASVRNDSVNPTGGLVDLGFRVASVPEPSSLSLLVLGGAVVALCRRKRA